MANVCLFCALVLKPALDALAEGFADLTGHSLTTTYESAAVIRDQVAGGATCDCTIVQRPAMAALVRQGAVVADTVTTLARSGIAAAVPHGSAKPDVSTPAALERALRQAKSLAYPDPDRGHASGIHFRKVLDQLGIATTVRARTRLMPGALTDFALSDTADIAITQPMEILATPGFELAGWLPPELQDAEAFTWSAGVCAAAREPDAARALLRYLVSPEAAAVIEAKGMMPGAA